MPTYDRHRIRVDDADIYAGAGFALSEPAHANVEVASDRSKGLLLAGSRICLVNVFAPAEDADLHDQALEAAQRTLDVDGAQQGRFLALPDAHTDYFLWWKDANGSRALLCTSSHLSVHFSVSAKVLRPDGSEAEVSQQVPTWNPAMRLFRYSQNTKDLFESYRYMFLAVESALSQRWPKTAGEGELHWFRRCNREIAALGLDFATCGGRGNDPVEDFTMTQYESFRCALFHAKALRGAFLPGGSAADRRLVANAVGALGEYLRGVFRFALSTPVYSGGMTIVGVQRLFNGFKDDLLIAVTDDQSPVDPADTMVSPMGLSVTDVPTRYLGVADGIGYEHDFAGEIAVGAMQASVVGRIVTKLDDALATGGQVHNLDLDGFDVFEVRHRWHWAKRWGGINVRFEF